MYANFENNDYEKENKEKQFYEKIELYINKEAFIIVG